MAEQASDLTVVGNVYPSGDVIDRTSQTSAPIWRQVFIVLTTGLMLIAIILSVNIAIFQYIDSHLRNKGIHVVWLLQTPIVLVSIYLAYLVSPMFQEAIRTMASPPL